MKRPEDEDDEQLTEEEKKALEELEKQQVPAKDESN